MVAPAKLGSMPGGWGLWRARNRQWTHPANRPLAFEPSPKEAQTRMPIGGSTPKGSHHNPLTFRRRWMALKKWLRLLRDHTPPARTPAESGC
jgi:hypothetical protein